MIFIEKITMTCFSSCSLHKPKVFQSCVLFKKASLLQPRSMSKTFKLVACIKTSVLNRFLFAVKECCECESGHRDAEDGESMTD